MEQDPQRVERFRQFIQTHIKVFASAAEEGFARRGRGAVVFTVADLVGRDEFRKQKELNLTYIPEAEVFASPDQVTAEMLRRCEFPHQAVIAALYSDGTSDVIRIGIRKAAEPDRTHS